MQMQINDEGFANAKIKNLGSFQTCAPRPMTKGNELLRMRSTLSKATSLRTHSTPNV
jgi:hypothetical protein